jgi:hypothetical protein
MVHRMKKETHMSVPPIGSYVTHAKMSELGSGEIVGISGPKISIRFGSGERDFVLELVEKHLQVTSEAPVAPPTKKSHKARAVKATS